MVERSNDHFLTASVELVTGLTELYSNWEGVKQFKGTPERLLRMYSEFCWSPEKIENEVNAQLGFLTRPLMRC